MTKKKNKNQNVAPVAAFKLPLESTSKTQTTSKSKSTMRPEGGDPIQDSTLMSVEMEFRPALVPKKASPPKQQLMHYDDNKPISKFPVPHVNDISLISTGFQ